MKIRPHEKLWHIDLGEIWRYRDLIALFVRRNIVVQYKQPFCIYNENLCFQRRWLQIQNSGFRPMVSSSIST